MITRSLLKLRIDALHERHGGLTRALGESFTEAATVCLDRHHRSPVELEVQATKLTIRQDIEFEGPDKRTLDAWANEIDATEFGAYGVCLAAVEAQEGLVAVKRAETLTGADWYVAPIGVQVSDLEACFRLEVSGTDAGSRTDVAARLRQKVEQTKKGNSNLPALASVVGFKERLVAISKVDGKA